MPFVTSMEQSGIRKGVLESIAEALEDKFGAAAAPLIEELKEEDDIDKLRVVRKAIGKATTLDELCAMLT